MSDDKQETPTAPKKSGARRKLAMLVMAGIIVIQGGVAGAYFLLADNKGSVPEVPPPPSEAAADEHGGHGHGEAHGADAHGAADAHAEEHADEHAADDHGHGGHDAHAEEEEEESADDGHGGGHGDAHGDAHGGHGEAKPGQIEVDLGEFSVSTYQSERDRTLFVSFHLYALVPSAREGKVTSQFDAQKHRIREKVLVLFRSATLAELSEPELGSLKGRTLETVNACFKKPLLEEVMFSDFVIVEQ